MNATDVVIDIYRNFPEVEFFDESDRPNDKVKLIFELNEANREMVEEHIKEYNLPYMFLGHTLLIIAPEDSEYKFYGEPLTDEEQAEADRMFPIESLEESKRQFGDIQQKGKAECDYTGGGIYVAYMPVRIKNDDLDEYCYLSYDSESLLIDGEDVPQFTAVHRYDDGSEEIEQRAGKNGVFVFDKASPYMPLFNQLKDAVIKDMEGDPTFSDFFRDGKFHDPTEDESLTESVDEYSMYKEIVGDDLAKEIVEFYDLYDPERDDYTDFVDLGIKTKDDILYNIKEEVKFCEEGLDRELNSDDMQDAEYIESLKKIISKGEDLIDKLLGLKESKEDKKEDQYKQSRERLNLPANKVHKDKSKYDRKEKHKKDLEEE